jgi:hypothetical protein
MYNDDLFQQGITTYETGDLATAALIFYRITRHDPCNQLAWLWLADCVEDVRDKRNFWHFAVSLDPHSDAGQRAARHLKRRTWLRLPPCLNARSLALYWMHIRHTLINALVQRLSARRSSYSPRQ